MDLQSHVPVVVFVRSQQAQYHVVGVSAGSRTAVSAYAPGERGGEAGGWASGDWGCRGHLHVKQLGSLVHADGNSALTPSLAEHFLQSIAHRVHPADSRARAGQPSARPLRREGRRPPSPQAHLPFSLLLCSREFLQSHIASASPSRGARAAPGPHSASRLCARSHPPYSAPAGFPPSLSGEPHSAASGPLEDKGPESGDMGLALSQPRPASFACSQAIGLCKLADVDTPTLAPPN